MNDEIKPEIYRRLSIAALVTGILVVCIGGLYNILYMFIADFIPNSILDVYIVPSVFGIILGLAVAAVACGSIDLKRIKTGICSRKGRGFDIAGIVLGGLFILIMSGMILGDILIPG
jgi:vacuolar-type H+-ATPase subunit I/STV1